MNYKDLDTVLNSLNHNDPIAETPFDISKRLIKENAPAYLKLINHDITHYKPLHLVLNKLDKDGYVISIPPKNDERFNKFMINYDGVQFLNSTSFRYNSKPYAQKRAIDITKRIWMVAKTIMIILNAVIIVYLMYSAIICDYFQILTN